MTGLRIDRSNLFKRFQRGIPDITAAGTAAIRGPLRAPSLDASLTGSVRGKSYSVPRFAATVARDSTGFAARIEAPSGVITPKVRLDRALISAKSNGRSGGLFPLECTIDAGGKGLSVFQSARVDTTGGVVLDVDALTVVVAEKDLRSVRPFRLAVPASAPLGADRPSRHDGQSGHDRGLRDSRSRQLEFHRATSRLRSPKLRPPRSPGSVCGPSA